ncbi:MAG: ETC complex I subunit [Pseudomonadota bacterium]
MIARIYQPAKTAMQSGQGRTKVWILEYEPAAPRDIDPLMGWTSSRDTNQQVKLQFDSQEAAVAYAERNQLDYTVSESADRKLVKKSYADNFKFGRIGSWTH